MDYRFEKYFRLALGLYQLVGGLIGLYIVFSTGLSLLLPHFWVFIIVLGFFSFSLYCGIILLRGKANSYELTLINQYLQTFRIILLGYGFEFYTGIKSYLGFTDSPNLKFLFKTELSFSSQAYLFMGEKNLEVSLAINIIPVLIIIWIYRLRDKEVIIM